MPVCQAVQHAHQKGIIHRDLKPSNILIALYDGQAVPKVIDFGVAKATSQTLNDKTLFTELGQVVGTLEYMSPEQAQRNQLDVDTRSDIYSLGVVLYELLTGSTPFERKRLREAAIDEVLRIIREEEPERPSLRLSSIETLPSVAASRRTEPNKLRTLVRGELDWIVMKALEKDRARRYDTANGFAADIQHYLNDEAVVACPPSAAYRFRKFARRNKASLATAAVIFAALLSGVVVSTWQWMRAEDARKGEAEQRQLADAEAFRANQEAQRAEVEAERARTEAAISKAVNDFVNNDLLEFADPEQEPDRNITLRSVLDRTSDEIERFEGAPLVEASIRHTLGKTYLSLGEYKTAEPHLKRAVDVRQALLGKEHRDTLRSMHLLAQVYHKQALYKKADGLNEETYALRLTQLGTEDPETLESMSSAVAIHISLGRYFEAETLCKRALELQRQLLGENAEATLTSKGQLAEIALKVGRYRDAEQLCMEALGKMDGALREHPQTLAIKSRLASVYQTLGHVKDAEKLHNEVVNIKIRVLGEEHPATLKSMHDIGALYAANVRSQESYDQFDRLLKMRQRALGNEHPDTLSTKIALAWVSSALTPENSDEPLEAIYNVCNRVLGSEHPYTMQALAVFAWVTGNSGNYDRSIKRQKEVLELRQRVLGRDHPRTLESMRYIASVYYQWRRHDESEEWCRQALAGQRRIFGEESIQICSTMAVLARLIEKAHPAEAERLVKQVVKIHRQTYGEDHIRTLMRMGELARIQERWEERLKVSQRIFDYHRRHAGEDTFFARRAMTNIARSHRESGDYLKAEEVYKRQLQIGHDAGRDVGSHMLELAELYKRWGRYNEAQNHLGATLENWLREKGRDHPKTFQFLDPITDLAAVCFGAKRYDQAEELCRQVLEVKPDHADAARNLCATLLVAKDVESYRRQCHEFLGQYSHNPDPAWGECVASCFCLYPWPNSELKRPLELARLAVDESESPDVRQSVTLGALLYRTGRLEEALAKLTEAVETRGADGYARHWLWLSMTHNALGNSEEARRFYDRGVAWLDQNASTPTVEVLQSEAAQRLGLLDQQP